MKRWWRSGLAATVLILLVATPAWGHVTVQPNEVQAGTFQRFVVQVPSENPDAPTTKIEVKFPKQVQFVSFEPVAGWTHSVQMVKLAKPIKTDEGDTIDQAVGSATWSGGEIKPGDFQEFPFSALVPDDATTLTFPAIQSYSNGDVVRWIGGPGAEEPAARVSAIDLGTSEEQGPLTALSNLQKKVSAMESSQEQSQPQTRAPAEESGSSNSLLSWIAIAVSAVALVVALVGRRGGTGTSRT
jgi:periplasmic copper chaperone A